MINFLKNFTVYNKKNKIIILSILYLMYILEINIQLYNLNDLIYTMNNLSIEKLFIAKIFTIIIYSTFKLVTFFIIFSIYYLTIAVYLMNFFDNKLLRKNFIYFSAIATVFKVIILNIFTILIIIIFKANCMNIVNYANTFSTATSIFSEILNIVSIFIIFLFFKFKDNNCRKISVIPFYIPYFIIIFIKILTKYIIK